METVAGWGDRREGGRVGGAFEDKNTTSRKQPGGLCCCRSFRLRLCFVFLLFFSRCSVRGALDVSKII